MALLVIMAVGANEVFGDHEPDKLVFEFGELLEGVEAEILKVPNVSEPEFNTAKTMQTEFIIAQVAYLDAFDEVIQKQII